MSRIDPATKLVALLIHRAEARDAIARLDWGEAPRAVRQAIEDVLEFPHVVRHIGLVACLRALAVDDAEELALAERAEAVPLFALFDAPPVADLMAAAIAQARRTPRPTRASRALDTLGFSPAARP